MTQENNYVNYLQQSKSTDVKLGVIK